MTEKDTRTPEEIQADNWAVFMEQGPRLSYRYGTYVIARNGKGRILVGGLGGMGVGSMWFDEQERHRNYPGYDDAKIMDE